MPQVRESGVISPADGQATSIDVQTEARDRSGSGKKPLRQLDMFGMPIALYISIASLRSVLAFSMSPG